MRIDLSPGIQASDSGKVGKSDTHPGSGPVNSHPDTDVATVSAEYTRAQALSAALTQHPDIRQEKVAALAERIRGGNYVANPEQTAEALILHMAGRAAA